MALMNSQIDKDYNRFRNIIKGKVKRNLRKYLGMGEMIGKQGKQFVHIPIPFIDIPTFRHGHIGNGGVGQGDGVGVGDPVYSDLDGVAGGAGQGEGQHIIESEFTLDELAEMMGEELELPNVEKKGKGNIVSEKFRYTGISNSGPESLRHTKRTFKQSLKRQLTSGEYNPDKPVFLPVQRDKRYRSIKRILLPESNVVIFYMMDVSGSMGNDQKTIVRTISFWIDVWVNYQYKGLDRRYIIHDAVAKEVDRHRFFHTRESGGTVISSAYSKCEEIIDECYNPNDWNIYLFHFSDGDNWGDTDDEAIEIVERLLPRINLFGYGQVASPYGDGHFMDVLIKHFKNLDSDNLILSYIESENDIYDSLKDFLGKGL